METDGTKKQIEELQKKEQLSRKERKRLRKLEKRLLREEGERGRRATNVLVKIGVFIILVGIVFGGGYFLIKNASKPLPGREVADQGREHIPKNSWEKYSYNSNPPTSGSHDEEWTKPGIYDEPQGDGHLVHSLEHGYIVISYNCAKTKVSCNALTQDLTKIVEKKKRRKLIIVPRPRLDVAIALTAWRRIDKMDKVDAARIEAFIDALRDKGPEQTMD